MACKGSWVRVPSAPPIQYGHLHRSGDRSASRWRVSSPARACFVHQALGRQRFVRDGSVTVALPASALRWRRRDRPLLEALAAVPRCTARSSDQPARSATSISRSATFTISSHAGPSSRDDPVRRDVPPPLRRSAVQFESWRDAIDEYEQAHPDAVRVRAAHSVRYQDARSRFVVAGSAEATTTVPPDTECTRAPSSAASSRPREPSSADGSTATVHVRGRPRCGRRVRRAGCFAEFFGCGTCHQLSRDGRRTTTTSARSSMQSLQDHLEVTIPFMDAHLPVSHKREQYLVWRDRLLDYWEHDAKRVRPCTHRRAATGRDGRTSSAATTSTPPRGV